MDIGLQNQLAKLCKLPVDQKWELKYRASRDGFSSSDFHSHCDGIANTLTVIKAKSGNVFGGFTEQEWHSRGDYVTDPKAFLFSLINKEVKPFKVMCSNEGENAIYCWSDYGPCFGGDDDRITEIAIHTDSNINKMSYCEFGYSYQHSDYEKDTDVYFSYFVQFSNSEIKVFSKSN